MCLNSHYIFTHGTSAGTPCLQPELEAPEDPTVATQQLYCSLYTIVALNGAQGWKDTGRCYLWYFITF